MSLTIIKFIDDKLISDKSIFGFRKFCEKSRSYLAHLQLGLPWVPGYPTGTRVINYPGNFLLPAATRVPEQKQITYISAIFNRIYGIRISIYRILTHHQWILW